MRRGSVWSANLARSSLPRLQRRCRLEPIPETPDNTRPQKRGRHAPSGLSAAPPPILGGTSTRPRSRDGCCADPRNEVAEGLVDGREDLAELLVLVRPLKPCKAAADGDPRHAAHHDDQIAGLVCSHELEDPDGIESVSRENQGAALASALRSDLLRPSWLQWHSLRKQRRILGSDRSGPMAARDTLPFPTGSYATLPAQAGPRGFPVGASTPTDRASRSLAAFLEEQAGRPPH